MNIIGNAFLYIKNNYIIPLIPYRIPHKRLDNYTLRYILASCPVAVKQISDHQFRITFKKQVFYQTILNEIQQFYIRSAQQDCNLTISKSNITKSWLMVTDYYKLFFTIHCFYRLTHSAVIYIDNTLSNQLSSLYTDFARQMLNIPAGTYTIYEKERSLSYVEVILKKSKKRAHETLWIGLYNILNMLKDNASNEELTILKFIQKSFSINGLTFLSTVRNKVNYRGDFAYHEIDKNFYYNIHRNQGKFIKNLIAATENNEFNNQLKLINLICFYFYYVNESLINELQKRTRCHFYYIKSFKKLTNGCT